MTSAAKHPLMRQQYLMERTWGTICSGREVLIFIMRSLKEMYKSLGFALHILHRFSCDLRPTVQDWIKSVAQESGESSADGNAQFCLFERAEDMRNYLLTCLRHGNMCLVPRVDLLMLGTSCKDVSRASNAYRAR